MRLIADYRALVGDTAAAQCLEQRSDRPGWRYVLIHSEFIVGAKNDRDNLIAWIKSGIDGLTDARILSDDRGVYYAPPKQRIDRNDPRVFLALTPIEPGEDFVIKVNFDT